MLWTLARVFPSRFESHVGSAPSLPALSLNSVLIPHPFRRHPQVPTSRPLSPFTSWSCCRGGLLATLSLARLGWHAPAQPAFQRLHAQFLCMHAVQAAAVDDELKGRPDDGSAIGAWDAPGGLGIIRWRSDLL